MSDPASATLHEAYGRRGALPPDIRALDRSMRVFGTAFTIATSIGDNLWLHRALACAPAGSVLVVATATGPWRDAAGAYGYWGALMTTAARRRGLGGLVIDGHVRDARAIPACGLPVFSRGVCVRGTTKDSRSPGALAEPVRIGDVSIATGDLVVGDTDGVVVIAADEAAAVLERAERMAEKEAELIDRIRRGATTLDLLGLE